MVADGHGRRRLGGIGARGNRACGVGVGGLGGTGPGGRRRRRIGEAQSFGGAIEETRQIVPAAGRLGFHQGIHEAKIGECITAVDHLAPVSLTAVTVDEPGGEGCTAQDHRHVDADLIEGFQVVLHEGGGFHQQPAHGDAVGPMLLLGLDDGIDALLDAKIDHLIAVVGEDDIHQILADVVHISLDSGDEKPSFTARSPPPYAPYGAPGRPRPPSWFRRSEARRATASGRSRRVHPPPSCHPAERC